MKKQLLMIPGPCPLSEEILVAMSRPMVPHYGAEWAQEFNKVRDDLKPLFGTKEEVYILVGSGYLAVEAGVNALAGPGDRILVVTNGFFGDQIAMLAQQYGIEPVLLKEEWGQPIDPTAVETALKDKKIKAVAVVHGDTSVGILNPVKEIGSITKRLGIPLFVDAVCSIGGTEVLMDEWGIDICATASQKGLSAPPGLAIISVSKRAWEVIESRETSPMGWYLNLKNWRDMVEENRGYHPHLTTMAVNNIWALQTSLKQFYEEGIPQRFQRHRKLSRYLNEGLRGLGLEILATGEPLPLVTAVKCPNRLKSSEIISYLKEKHNILITGGLGIYKDSIFRIGLMGNSARKEAIDDVLDALRDFMEHQK